MLERACAAIIASLLGFTTLHAANPCGELDHTHSRAGNPLSIAPWAKPAVTCRYLGGYVGGGCLRHGEGRDLERDGTWGLDYVGRGRWPQRIFLGWCHDRCKQPKNGTYQTDGRHVPDVLAAPSGAKH